MALHTIVEHDSTHIKPYIDAKIGNFTGKNSDNEPYVLRQGLGNLADMDLVGGSLAWNQKVVEPNNTSTTGGGHITFTKTSAGTVRVQSDGQNTAADGIHFTYDSTFQNMGVGGHKLLLDARLTSAISGISQKCYVNTQAAWTGSSDLFGGSKPINQVIIASVPSGCNFLYWYHSMSANITCDYTAKPQIFDLTQMFGPTIADYIYSLETATAGAGVAWFRKYFPNAYYGYQSGKIESVNVASREVVGKNLLKNTASSTVNANVTFTVNLDGSVSTSGKSNATGANPRSVLTLYNGVNPLKIGGSYILSGCPANGGSSKYEIMCLLVDSNNNTTNVSFDYGSGVSFTVPVGTVTMRVYIRTTNNIDVTGFTFYPMIRLATVEDDTYEPYQSSTYAFDSSKQLRGIFYLDANNKLCADGDIYKADGSITRKYGIVDLGTLDYAYISANGYMASQNVISNAKAQGKAIVSDKFVYSNDISSVTIPSFTIYTGKFYCALSGYTDPATFKTAVSGIYLVYELATPTTESANPYQNPQRAFIAGTEEFIDAGVTAGTRDVSIPVGNNTTYQLNETLPPIEDYVDGAVKFKAAISALGTDESGRTTASRAYTAGEFFYKDGKMYKVLTSIAQGATFTINTNCQQTTLFAELKALAQ